MVKRNILIRRVRLQKRHYELIAYLLASLAFLAKADPERLDRAIRTVAQSLDLKFSNPRYDPLRMEDRIWFWIDYLNQNLN